MNAAKKSFVQRNLRTVLQIALFVVLVWSMFWGVMLHQSVDFDPEDTAHAAALIQEVAAENELINVIRGVDEKGKVSFMYEETWSTIVYFEGQMFRRGWSAGMYTPTAETLSEIARDNTPNKRWVDLFAAGTTVSEANRVLTWIPVRLLMIFCFSALAIYSFRAGDVTPVIISVTVVGLCSSLAIYDMTISMLPAISLLGVPAAALQHVFAQLKNRVPNLAAAS